MSDRTDRTSHHLQMDVSRSDDNFDVIGHFAFVQLFHKLLRLSDGLVTLPIAANKELSLSDHGCYLPAACSASARDTLRNLSRCMHAVRLSSQSQPQLAMKVEPHLNGTMQTKGHSAWIWSLGSARGERHRSAIHQSAHARRRWREVSSCESLFTIDDASHLAVERRSTAAKVCLKGGYAVAVSDVGGEHSNLDMTLPVCS